MPFITKKDGSQIYYNSFSNRVQGAEMTVPADVALPKIDVLGS